MKKSLVSVFFLAVLMAGTALALASGTSSSCPHGACFPPEREVGGQKLPLRGTGLLQYLKLDMYSGAFYAPEGVDTPAEAQADIPKSLILHYHRGIKVKWMNDAAERILKKNPEVDFPALQERLDRIAAAYEKVGKDDRYELRYTPGTGTTLLLNDREIITLPGEDFARAYMGIWLSETPANKKFRDKLLGGE